MCGEIDEDVLINSEIHTRLRVMAQKLGVDVNVTPDTGPQNLAEESGRGAYMETLFQAGLTRAVHDTNAADDAEKVDALASQAIAFARLAGFIAGQLPAEADLFRTTVEALTAGHAEPRRMMEALKDHHHHDHDHHHDHQDDGHHHH